VLATTPEEEFAPPCIDDVADYFSLVEYEVVFQDLEQEAKPETSLLELKQLPPGLKYVFLNGDHETRVIISDRLSNDEITQSLGTHNISMEQEHKPVREHQRR
jgi:hypothetical protein